MLLLRRWICALDDYIPSEWIKSDINFHPLHPIISIPRWYMSLLCGFFLHILILKLILKVFEEKKILESCWSCFLNIHRNVTDDRNSTIIISVRKFKRACVLQPWMTMKKCLSLVMCVLYLRESCIIYWYRSACEFIFLSLINQYANVKRNEEIWGCVRES